MKSILLPCISEQATISNISSRAELLKLEKNIEKFKAYSNPRKNITYSQFKFFSCVQEIGQSFERKKNLKKKKEKSLCKMLQC